MRPGDAAPDHAELGAALEGLGLVDVGEALLLLLVLTMFERRWGERVSEFFFSCFEGGSAREREAAAVAAAARSGSIAMGPLFLSSHLAEVELRLALGLDALDLDERRVVVLRALPPVWKESTRERAGETEEQLSLSLRARPTGAKKRPPTSPPSGRVFGFFSSARCR